MNRRRTVGPRTAESDTEERSAQSRPRLAIVIPSLRGGIRYHAPMIRALAEEGFAVTVFTGIPPGEPSPFPLEVVNGRVLRDRIDETGYAKPFMLTSPRLVVSLVRWRPDVVVSVEYGAATLWSLVAGLVRRFPVAILQEHRSPSEYLRSPTRRVFRLILARLADGFVANTREAAEEIVTRLGVSPEKVFEVPMLLPPPRDYLLGDPVELPSGASRPVFLFVGQLIGRKNVRILLEAARRLVGEGRRFTLWIVGDGPDREDLERSVESTGVGDVVSFLGAVPYRSIGHAYEASDVFVMPTFADVMSVAVLEATRFEKPVIGSKRGGYAGHLVVDGVNGFLFDPANADELADRMAAFIDDPQLAGRMGARSAERLAGLSHQGSARRLAHVLRSSVLG